VSSAARRHDGFGLDLHAVVADQARDLDQRVTRALTDIAAALDAEASLAQDVPSPK